MNKVTALAILVLVYNNIILCSYAKPGINARAFSMPRRCAKEKVRFCFESDMYPTDVIDGVFEKKNLKIKIKIAEIRQQNEHLKTKLLKPIEWVINEEVQKEWQNDDKKIMVPYMLRAGDPLVPECDIKSAMRMTVYYVLDDKNETRMVVYSAKYNYTQNLDFMECMKEGPIKKSKHFSKHDLFKTRVNINCKNINLPVDLLVLKKGFEADFEIIRLKMPVFCKAYIN